MLKNQQRKPDGLEEIERNASPSAQDCLSGGLCGGGVPTQYCTLGEVVSCVPRGEGILSRGQSWWQLVSKSSWVAIQLHNPLAGGSS